MRLCKIPLLILMAVPGTVFSLVAPVSAAGLQPAPLFQDHMVLQRRRPVPVFGRDLPGSGIRVEFAGQTAATRADAEGRWEVTLPPLPAHPGGRDIVIRGSSDIRIRDVAVGEVWLAAGQSNMDWPLSRANGGVPAEVPAQLRFCNWQGQAGTPARSVYGTPEFANLTPETFYRGQWILPDSASLASCSAVAVHFALRLARELEGTGPGGTDVPVGVIEFAVGGTTTEAFLPPEVLQADPVLSAAFTDPRGVRTLGGWARGRIAENLKGYTHTDPQRPHPHPFAPGFLFETGVERIAPFAVQGVIWYQGESNADFATAPTRWNGARMQQHQEKVLRLLVQSWRQAFHRPDLPFYMVQLPRIRDAQRAAWPWYREAQRRVARGLEGVELAVVPEAGTDGPDVHPRDKQPVGRRLAAIALNRIHGRDTAFRSPEVRRSHVSEDRIILEFDDGPLISRDGHGVRHFEIAGADRVFVPALADVDGRVVQVYAPEVREPVAVRYGWDMNPELNLSTADGRTVGPFRTDDWGVAPGRPVRIACIGDSITEGAGMPDAQNNAYPARLQQRLDPSLFVVRNFGHSGTGVLRPGRRYLESPRHQAALEWQPDVVICNLGINDITMGDGLEREAFLRAYQELIDAYADLPTAPAIVLWTPLSPLFPGQRFHGDPRLRDLEAWIAETAARTGAETLNMRSGLEDHPEWYPDRLHPNADGARFIAGRTAAFLEETTL